MNHLFKPGNKFGKGRPRKDDTMKVLAESDRKEVQIALSDAMKTPVNVIDEMLLNKSLTALQLASLRVMKQATDGNVNSFDFVLNRTVGNPKEHDESDEQDADLNEAYDKVINIVPREQLIRLLQIKGGDSDSADDGGKDSGGNT